MPIRSCRTEINFWSTSRSFCFSFFYRCLTIGISRLFLYVSTKFILIVAVETSNSRVDEFHINYPCSMFFDVIYPFFDVVDVIYPCFDVVDIIYACFDTVFRRKSGSSFRSVLSKNQNFDPCCRWNSKFWCMLSSKLRRCLIQSTLSIHVSADFDVNHLCLNVIRHYLSMD